MVCKKYTCFLVTSMDIVTYHKFKKAANILILVRLVRHIKDKKTQIEFGHLLLKICGYF